MGIEVEGPSSWFGHEVATQATPVVALVECAEVATTTKAVSVIMLTKYAKITEGGKEACHWFEDAAGNQWQRVPQPIGGGLNAQA